VRPTAYPWRFRKGLNQAIQRAGLTGADCAPPRIVPHQLRHTYATTLVKAGRSLQALMAVLGHVTPEMTLRTATLASPTLRIAYDEAIGKAKAHRQLPIVTTTSPAPPAPTNVEWLASEFLKTRVAHGYCSLHLAGDASPVRQHLRAVRQLRAHPEFIPALQAQLADIIQLLNDAERRGWSSELERHSRVIARLEEHLTRLASNLDSATSLTHPQWPVNRADLRRDPPTHQGHRSAPRRAFVPVAGVGGAGPRQPRLTRLTMTPRALRLLQDLRRQLLHPPRLGGRPHGLRRAAGRQSRP
jgi:hypothetical protein